MVKDVDEKSVEAVARGWEYANEMTRASALRGDASATSNAVLHIASGGE